ncbi:MAG TPA: long-chain fatty acid--CoA ligase [Kofleriaceae bacterium]|nr:long-chain fatty acid--CoA ligase [Kofleriaceae bacterium]
MMNNYANLVDLAADSVKRFADRPLFGEKIDGTWKWITYAEWQKQVDALRAGLADLGVQPGDRIAIISRNSTAWATAAYASYGLGAAFIPMYEAQRAEDWEFILHDCGASVVFARTEAIATTLEGMRARVPGIRHIITMESSIANPRSLLAIQQRGKAHPVPPRDVAPGDLAGLVYTSGTTGKPKGAMLTHANLTTNVAAALTAFPMEPTDRTLSFLPWAHVYGQVVELHILVAAGGSTAFNTDTKRLVEEMREVTPTILVAVPRVFNQIHASVREQIEHKPAFIRRLFWKGHELSVRMRRGERIGAFGRVRLWLAGFLFGAIRRKFGGKLRYAISASATLSKEVAEFIDGLGIEVYEGYGLTETSPVVSTNTPGKRKMGSVGRAIQDVRIVIDETRGDTRGEGEIVVYGPNVMKGYHERPDENARAFTQDGGLRTGDIGRLDEDGYLFITGRIKEQYKLENGKYVMPAPLEERLALSPFIKNVMLHGAGRAYNVALVVVDDAKIAEWAAEQHMTLAADITQDPRVRSLIAAELERQGRDFRGYERPRNFVMTTTPFTIENGLLTPTLKLKRRDVVARYGAALDALYAGPEPEMPVPPPGVPELAFGRRA